LRSAGGISLSGGGNKENMPLAGVAEEGGHAREATGEEVSDASDGEGDSSGSSVGSQTTGSGFLDVGWQHGAHAATIKEDLDEEEWEEEWEEGWGGHYGEWQEGLRGDAEQQCSTLQSRHTALSTIETKATAWIRTEKADLFFGGIIAMNALVIGLEVEAELRFGDESVMATVLYWVQCSFALVFVAELLLRVRAYGLRQLLCRNLDGIFDAAVVLITVVDLWVVNPLMRFTQVIGGQGQKSLEALSMLRILQLLRLVRIIRLLRVSRQLSLLVLGLAKSFRSVLWVFLMLFVVIYIGALFCASELGAADHQELQRAFGTIWSSMYSHFKIMTLEAWPDLCGWAMEQSNLWAAYFIGYILITNLALVNLVTGLVMDGVLQGGRVEDWSSELMVVEAGPFVQTVRNMIGAQDQDHDCFLDKSEFNGLLADPFFQEVLEVYGISLRIEPDDLFEVLDVRGSGRLSVMEVAGSLLRLRGSREALHPLLVRDDLHKESRRVLGSLKACEQRVSERYTAEVHLVERSLCTKLKELQQAASSQTSARRSRSAAAQPQKLAGFACDAKQEAPPAPAPLKEDEVLQASAAEAAADGDAADTKGAGEVVGLLRQASARVRLLEDAVRRAEAELRASLAKEAALEAELARRAPSCATQTLVDLETVELEMLDEVEETEAEEKGVPPPTPEGVVPPPAEDHTLLISGQPSRQAPPEA